MTVLHNGDDGYGNIARVDTDGRTITLMVSDAKTSRIKKEVLISGDQIMYRNEDGYAGEFTMLTHVRDEGLSLETGMVAYGGTWAPPSAHLSPDRVVTLEGLVKPSTSGTKILKGALLLTLPEGMRPKAASPFIVSTHTGAKRIDIRPNGRVTAYEDMGDWTSIAATFKAAE